MWFQHSVQVILFVPRISYYILCHFCVVKTDTWNVFTGDIIPKHTLALETSKMCGVVINNALQELS